ncbi:unnamed protein product [Ixodes pacificus]
MAKPLAAPAKSTQRDDLTLFLEERLTDVEFLVEYGSHPPKVVKAHKMILAIRNEVFEAMFYGNLPEKDQVRITDLHPDEFFAFIKYLYTRKATFVDIQQAVHTRAAAQKYMDSKGMQDCDTFIQKQIVSTNVCIVLDYLVKYGNTANLDGIVDNIVAESTRQVLMSEAFIAASRESVMRILKNPKLRIPEYEIITGVYNWAVARCKQEPDKPTIATLQQNMKPFLPELRFLTLTAQEFVRGPTSWKVMTASEALAVLSNILKPGSEKLPEVICKSTENRIDGKHPPQYTCPWCRRTWHQ